jgi:hypothetical protein
MQRKARQWVCGVEERKGRWMGFRESLDVKGTMYRSTDIGWGDTSGTVEKTWRRRRRRWVSGISCENCGESS